MKIGAVVLVGVAISLALPISAQQTDTVDPEIRQQIEAVLMKFDEAYNNHDAAAIAALFTPDAVEVFRWGTEGGAVSGQQAIQRRYEAEASPSSGSNMSHKLVQLYPVGNDICAFSEYSVMMWKGRYLVIYVRDADT
jgi:ketosteroid isomerase-like protein